MGQQFDNEIEVMHSQLADIDKYLHELRIHLRQASDLTSSHHGKIGTHAGALTSSPKGKSVDFGASDKKIA